MPVFCLVADEGRARPTCFRGGARADPPEPRGRRPRARPATAHSARWVPPTLDLLLPAPRRAPGTPTTRSGAHLHRTSPRPAPPPGLPAPVGRRRQMTLASPRPSLPAALPAGAKQARDLSSRGTRPRRLGRAEAGRWAWWRAGGMEKGGHGGKSAAVPAPHLQPPQPRKERRPSMFEKEAVSAGTAGLRRPPLGL